MAAYETLDRKLATQDYLAGDTFSVADAYLWATWWSPRSGAQIDHLQNLAAWKARMDARASVVKTLMDEAEVVAAHRELMAT